MKKAALAIFIILGCNPLFAQTNGIISGTVKDKNTQEELMGAVLTFMGQDTINTITNQFGNFSVQLPVGRYNLEVSYFGYKSYALYNINLSSGNAQILQIELE